METYLDKVRALHRKVSLPLRSESCYFGDCDHDSEEECAAAMKHYDLCDHCFGIAMEIDDETSRWDEVALWPCATAVAFGAA